MSLRRILKRFFRPDCLPCNPTALKLVANRIKGKVLRVISGKAGLEMPLHGVGVFYNAVDGLYFKASGDMVGFMMNHERFQDRFMAGALEEGSVFIDVGAHIGRFTLLGASLVGETGLVVALEPDLRVLRFLKANVGLNAFRNVIPLPAAASDLDGVQRLHLSGTSGWSSLHEARNEVAEAWVPAFTLDTVFGSLGLGRVDLVKVDVEGAEDRVLEGAVQMLEAFQPALLMEVHTETAWKRCKDVLEEKGYAYEVIHRDPISPGRHFHIYACG